MKMKKDKETDLDIAPEHAPYIDMIKSIARNYAVNVRCGMEDYISVGMMALSEAIRKYNPDENPNTKLSTFAYPFIDNAIRQEFQRSNNTLSGCTPYHIKNTEGAAEEIKYINTSIVSITATRGDLDGAFGANMPINLTLRHANPKWAWRRPLLREVIVESGVGSPSEQAERMEIADKVDKIIAELPRQDQEIVFRRAFSGDTFKEIAAATGISERQAHYKWERLQSTLKEGFIAAGLECYAKND